MRNYIKANNFINITKSLLFLYILSYSSINFVKAEVINVQRSYRSGGITWKKLDDNNDVKGKLNKEKTQNEELYSFPPLDPNKNLREEGVSNNIKNKTLIKLEQIEDLIRDNSNELKMIAIRIEEARYLLKSEVSAWYPNFNISSTGFPQYIDGNTYNNLSTNTSNRQTKAGLKATLKWDLINPSRIPQIELARDQFEKARLAYSIKYRQLLLDTYIQFFNLQKSIQEIRIARDSIKFSETSLKEAITRKNSGLGTSFDVLESKTQLSKDKQLLVEKIGYKKINERKLSQLLNLKSNTIPTINSVPKIIGFWDTGLEKSIIKSHKYREELDSIQLGISINNNKANIASSMTKPKVSLYNSVDGYIAKGEIGVASPRYENNINSTNTTIGIQFDWPIFDGGYGKAKYYASKEKVKEVQAELALKKSEIRKEIEESFFKLNIAKENIKNSSDAIQSAKESLRLSVLRLKAGITTQREVVNNQRDLTQAEVNHIQALTDYNIHIISLRSKTGLKGFKDCTKKISRNNSSIKKRKDNGHANHLPLNMDSCMELS